MLKTIFGVAALATTIAGVSFAQSGAAAGETPTLRVSTTSVEARALFFRAWDEGNRGNRAAAADLATRAVQLDTTFGLARVLRACASTGTLTPQLRVSEMQRGVADAANGSGVEGMLARSIQLIFVFPPPNMFPSGIPSNMTTGTLGRWHVARQSARIVAESVARIIPNDPHVAYFLTALADTGRFDDELREVVRRFPTLAIVHHTMAMRRSRAGDAAGAELEMREYLRLAPASPHAHYSYGLLVLQSQRFGEALPHFEQALRLDPTVAVHSEGMATTQSRLGNYAGAVQHMRRAIELEPGAPIRYRLLAEIHLAAGYPDSALAEHRRSIASNPSYLAAYSNMAGVYMKLGKFAEAADAFRQQAQQSPTPVGRVTPLTQAALVQVMAGRPAEAISELQAVVRMAEQIDGGPAAGLVQYRDMALVEAALGDRTAARVLMDRWVSAANLMNLGSAALPAANQAPSARAVALTLAMSGSLQEAKSQAALFQTLAAASGPAERSQYHEILAIIAALEGDLTATKTQLDLAGDAALLGRVIYAEALNRVGRRAEANAIKSEVLAAPGPFTLTAYYAIVIAKARVVTGE